jgi:hypothetical protein
MSGLPLERVSPILTWVLSCSSKVESCRIVDGLGFGSLEEVWLILTKAFQVRRLSCAGSGEKPAFCDRFQQEYQPFYSVLTVFSEVS